MAGGKHLMTGLLVLVVAGAFVYLVDPTMFGLLKMKQGFNDMISAPSSTGEAGPGQMQNPGTVDMTNTYGTGSGATGDRKNGNPLTTPPVETFSDLASMEGPANFGSSGQPAGCYPRDQLTPSDLLPKDQNSVWAEQNPMGPGSLKGKNFLSAGALIGVNTVGQSLRNANYQLRSEPPNPQIPVSIFNQSTIAPDTNRRPLEIN